MPRLAAALAALALFAAPALRAQPSASPPATDARLYAIASGTSPANIRADVDRLAGFGTRATFSDTVSTTRGIGAARRWIKGEFERISAACGGCLDVREQRTLVPGGSGQRIPRDVWVVNIVATQRGTERPDQVALMSADIDSRNTSGTDGERDAPGANDNASGIAGLLDAARVLTGYRFPGSIVYAALSAEEVGLIGGQHLAAAYAESGTRIVGVLNNDMIGNTCGITGDCTTTGFRIFSEGTPPTETERQRASRRFYGGEVDGPSRQLARYIARLTHTYLPTLDARMVYRLDRFGRGGHHRPFNDQGFAGVRIMEAHEHYDRQHQDLRAETRPDGTVRRFGDTAEFVDPLYAARLTAVNAVTLASLAWAPAPPDTVRIGGAVSPSTTLDWSPVAASDLAGYVVYWRDTTAPQWTHRRFVGNVTRTVLENVVIDDYYFGIAAVSTGGHESLVVFPTEVGR